MILWGGGYRLPVVETTGYKMSPLQGCKSIICGMGGYRLPVVETTGYKMSPFQGCKRKILNIPPPVNGQR